MYCKLLCMKAFQIQVVCSLKRAVAASALRYFSSFVVLLIGDRKIVESCAVLYIFAGKH